MSRLASVTILAASLLAASSPARAALFGVQIDTDSIVELDPSSGSILRSFPAPDPGLLPTHLGLSGAENGSVLLWMDPTGQTTLELVTRINPITGAVLDYHDPPYLSTIDGLTSERIGGVDYIIVGGRSDGIVVQHGYDSTDFTSISFGAGAYVFSLGGDGFGRSFVFCSDKTLREFNPLTGAVLHTFPFLAGVNGLAFDGQFLYATNLIVQNDAAVTELYTINPDTGEILHATSVAGGPLGDLAVAIPEPTSSLLVLSPLPFLCRRKRTVEAS